MSGVVLDANHGVIVKRGRSPHTSRYQTELYSSDLDPVVLRAVEATGVARAAAEAAEPALHHANTTDPDSRIMKTKTGFVQGYNCQSAVNENQIVVACAVTQERNDGLT